MLRGIILGLVIFLGLSIFANFYFYTDNSGLQQQLSDIESKNVALTSQISTLNAKLTSLEGKISQPVSSVPSVSQPKQVEDKSNVHSITAVAVRPILSRSGFFQDVQYEGTVMTIELSIHDGSGLVLVNTAIPTGVDFQSSAKIAAEVAEKYLQTDLSDKDIIFSITADENEHLQAVDGQSAGAAMTVLLISSLQDKPIKNDVIMTGTINSDMSIGKIGGVKEKADAAGNHGAKIFLVPSTQGVTFVEECKETRTGNFIYRDCSSEQKPLSPITEEKYGMKTIEVSNIQDALLYFQ